MFTFFFFFFIEVDCCRLRIEEVCLSKGRVCAVGCWAQWFWVEHLPPLLLAGSGVLFWVRPLSHVWRSLPARPVPCPAASRGLPGSSGLRVVSALSDTEGSRQHSSLNQHASWSPRFTDRETEALGFQSKTEKWLHDKFQVFRLTENLYFDHTLLPAF